MHGARLAKLRNGRLQSEIEAATDIPQQAISDYERREPGMRLSRLARMDVAVLADYYGVSVAYIMGESDDEGRRTPGLRRQMEEIFDALPPERHADLVSLARSLLAQSQEQERTQGGRGASPPSARAS